MKNFKLTVLKNAEPIAENSLLLIKGGVMPRAICNDNTCGSNTITCDINTCTRNSATCNKNICTQNWTTPCNDDVK